MSMGSTGHTLKSGIDAFRMHFTNVLKIPLYSKPPENHESFKILASGCKYSAGTEHYLLIWC